MRIIMNNLDLATYGVAELDENQMVDGDGGFAITVGVALAIGFTLGCSPYLVDNREAIVKGAKDAVNDILSVFN